MCLVFILPLHHLVCIKLKVQCFIVREWGQVGEAALHFPQTLLQLDYYRLPVQSSLPHTLPVLCGLSLCISNFPVYVSSYLSLSLSSLHGAALLLCMY